MPFLLRDYRNMTVDDTWEVFLEYLRHKKSVGPITIYIVLSIEQVNTHQPILQIVRGSQ